MSFTFSVVSDDGNLASVLTAGASDLLTQLGNNQAASMFSCLLLQYSGPPPAQSEEILPAADSSSALLIDPSL